MRSARLSLGNNYFVEKKYVNKGESANEFDVALLEKNCSEFRKNKQLCDRCYNEALIEKMQDFNALQRLDFINYQLNRQSDPLDWLKRMKAFLYDNEDEFGSFNYKMYLEYVNIIDSGISQLSETKAEPKPKKTTNNFDFIHLDRVEALRNTFNEDYDLCKLIAYCEEINLCYRNECYLAVAMLTRALIDHIPPIFGQQNFQSVSSQYGSRSFKGNMASLDGSLRKIADSYLHSHIRNKEVLPSPNQVNFSQDLDVLLGEICRILKK